MKKLFIYLITCTVTLFSSLSSSAQYGTVVPLICNGYNYGTYNSGFGGDGGGAIDSAVKFNHPAGISVDSAGDIFIFDAGNTRVRKINHQSLILVTIAGQDSTGFAGDGGPGPLARLAFVDYGYDHYSQLYADKVGNCYLTDAGNFRIRKIDHNTGFVTTVAGNGIDSFSGDGGPAVNAGMNPEAVYVNANGDMFISGDYRIRKVSAATGIIQTIAGNGVDSFEADGPALNSSIGDVYDIKGDAFGNIYFSEYRKIRKLDTAGMLTTIVGSNYPDYSLNFLYSSSGYFGISGDGGPVSTTPLYVAPSLDVDSAGNIFFASDICIKKISAATGIVNTVAGRIYTNDINDPYNKKADSISMEPLYIKLDGAGNIYYTDANGFINKIVGAQSAINTLSIKDTTISAPCSFPATVRFGVNGTINGIPSSTDSIDISIDHGDVVNSIKNYRIPYWHTSTYGFGYPGTFIDTYTYRVPGSYLPVVTIHTLGGYVDVGSATPVVVGANCDTSISAIYFNITDTFSSTPCSPPMNVRFHVAGNINGTPSSGDSVYLVYKYIEQQDSAYDVRVVPYVLQNGGYNFYDTVDHPYTPGMYSPYITATTSSGLHSTLPSLPFFTVDDCSTSSVQAFVNDDGWEYLHCSLPLSDLLYVGATLTGYAATAPNVKMHVDFGDGTDTSFIAYVGSSPSGGYYAYTSNIETTLPHTYTQYGSFSASVSDTAGAYFNTSSGPTITIANGCTPVTGSFYIDVNQDCLFGSGDVPLSYWPYALVDNTVGDTTYSWCDAYGNYTLYLSSGDNYTIVANPDAYFHINAVGDTLHTSCPASGIDTFTANSAAITQNFGFSCAPPSSLDMSVNGWGWGFVPGDTGFVSIWSSSPTGYICDSLYSTVTLTLDPLLTFVGMWDGPYPTTIAGNILTWTYSTVNNLFDLDAHVMVATNTTAGMGAQVCNTLSITPSQLTDPDTTNNIYTWCLPVKSSWDPNEKQASPLGSGANGYIPMNTPLSYIIHFQNKGTASTKNITVRDTIDTHMDMSTIQITSSSAPVQMYQDPGNILRFRFSNYFLPDSADDPEGSKGYIAYNISPKHGLPPGTVVTNDAGIYFDYNPAVVTNTTINTYQNIGAINGPAFACLGAYIQLSDTAAGGTWSVSNTNATISSTGLLSAVHQGYVTVSYNIPGIGNTTKTVFMQAPPSPGVISGPNNVCVDSMITLIDTAQNSSGTWTNSNSNAVLYYNGVIYGLAQGIDTITYQVTNTCATRDTFMVITIGDPTLCSSGVSSLIAGHGLEIFPNPASTEITIKVNGLSYNSFNITNSIGQILSTHTIATTLTKVNISELSPGIYFFIFNGNEGKTVKKFIKM